MLIIDFDIIMSRKLVIRRTMNNSTMKKRKICFEDVIKYSVGKEKEN